MEYTKQQLFSRGNYLLARVQRKADKIYENDLMKYNLDFKKNKSKNRIELKDDFNLPKGVELNLLKIPVRKLTRFESQRKFRRSK